MKTKINELICKDLLRNKYTTDELVQKYQVSPSTIYNIRYRLRQNGVQIKTIADNKKALYWDDEMRKFLIDHQNLSDEDVARALDKSKQAVAIKRYYMRRAGILPKPKPRKSMHFWTPAQEDYLKTHTLEQAITYGQKLGVSKQAAMSKYYKLHQVVK